MKTKNLTTRVTQHPSRRKKANGLARPPQRRNGYRRSATSRGGGETGTPLPRRHLTFLPTPAVTNWGGMETTTYRACGYRKIEIRTRLQDAIQAHLQYARCDALYFDFREGPVDPQLYRDCSQKCLAKTEFLEGTRVMT